MVLKAHQTTLLNTGITCVAGANAYACRRARSVTSAFKRAKMPESALSVFRRRCEAGDAYALLRIPTPKLDRLHVSPHKKLFELILTKV